MSVASQIVVYCNLIIVSAFLVFCSVHAICITFMLIPAVVCSQSITILLFGATVVTKHRTHAD